MDYKLDTPLSEKMLAQHLNNFLNDFEARFDNNEELSPELIEDYIEAAKTMSRLYGRKGDRVDLCFMMLSDIAR